MNRIRLITNWEEVPVLVDVPYLVRILGCSEVTVRRLLTSGEIPARKVGANWRIRKEALMEYLGY